MSDSIGVDMGALGHVFLLSQLLTI